MKTVALLTAASILLASSLLVPNVFAQSSAPTTTNNVPPPPGINDPGVQPVAPPAKGNTATTQHAGQPALPSMQDAGDPGNGKQMSLPEVSVHEQGEDQVQEYRRSGMLYMIVVTPKNGIPQIYNVDPDGTKHLQPGEPPVQPVMYKVLEWGKSKPAEADSSGAAQDDSGH